MANCVSVSSECVLILMWGFPLLFYFFFFYLTKPFDSFLLTFFFSNLQKSS